MSIAIEVIRDAGDRDGGEIIEPLLGSNLTAALARGRAELDAHALPRDRITIELDMIDTDWLGRLVEIIEPAGGAPWRAMVIGVGHTWDGRTATTQLELSRPRFGASA